MDEKMNYYAIDRKEWQDFYRDGVPPLSENELNRIKSFNDKISMKDVQNIYIPLTHLAHIYMKEFESLQLSKGLFLHSYLPMPPFIIGIAGSVAVGKSTTARLLQIMLQRTFKRRNVELITTDGFLYPNKVLEKKGILNHKGFPESYDMEKLINFLNNVKNNHEDLKVPLYSHSVYDIVEGEYEVIRQPDILIVEGINTLQLPANQRIYVSDFFDFTIYIDADPKLNKKWYLDRFMALLEIARTKPDNYYYQFANWPLEKAKALAENVWENINLKNLNEYILPTRSRADVVMHKTDHHHIDKIYLRKY